MKYIPNLLSFLRLALCPAFIWAFFNLSSQTAFFIFLTASLLDVIDGFIARKFDAVSSLGKILDPVADKVLQLSALVCFTLKGSIPYFAVLIIVLKELFMLIGGGIISKKQGDMVYSNTFGKISSFCTSFSLCLLFFIDDFLKPSAWFVYIILYFSLVLSVISLIQYGIGTLSKEKAAKIKNQLLK